MRELLLAFVGGLCPALIFNVDRKKIIWVGICGTIGWLTYSWMLNFTGHVVFSTFVGAVVVGVFSETMARILKTPATVFSVSGIFPLVPGIGAYTTVKYIVEGNINNAASSGIETVASAGAIALGIMFVSAIFQVFIRLFEK